MDAKLVKIQHVAGTAFGVIMSILFTVFLVLEVCKEFRNLQTGTVAEAVNLTAVIGRSKLIEKMLNISK